MTLKHRYSLYILLGLLLFITYLPLSAQQKTLVKGVVLEAGSRQPLPYVSVQFAGETVGVVTDNYGRFLLEKNGAAHTIKVSYIGYETQSIKIKPFINNDIKVVLSELNAELKEITIRPEKYKKKNPAVDLIQQVFIHKDQNRKEGLDYYQYTQHEILRFDLNGITTPFKNKWYFKPFKFAFDYCDTNAINQKVKLPFYLRERLLTSYFRKKPYSKFEKLNAEKQTALQKNYDIDSEGIASYINSMYADIDIYEPKILLLDKEFIGPLSGIATGFYRFYITDTVEIDSQRFADIFFAPINKNDLAFIGHLWVSLDSTYAVKRVEMGISKDINLNWVADIQIKQYYEFQGEGHARRLLLDKDELLFDMKIWKNREGRSLMVNKKSHYRDYLLNQPLADSLYKTKATVVKDTGDLAHTPQYWQERRIGSLSDKEEGVIDMVERIKATRAYKYVTGIGVVLATGYQKVGAFEIGSLPNLYRFNDVEGDRFQLNMRTNDRYFKHVRVRAYGAYGLKDQAWKYGGNLTVGLKGARPGRFPVHQIRAGYEHDLFFPGTNTNISQNILNSAQRAGTNRLLLNRISKLEYSREHENGLSYSLRAQHTRITEAGVAASAEPIASVSMETGAWVRFAPKEKFYQGAEQRTSIRSRYPVFFLETTAGLKGVLGGQFAYQKWRLRIDKTFYVAPFGKSRWNVEAGQVFGQVSYPLLEIHRANQSYFFDNNGFNLMNYLEFVSDRYAMLHINHDFEGILFNRLPLIKKYKWREGATLKVLYGQLSDRNNPALQPQLQRFPVDADNRALTQGLGNQPYVEASLGIGNIFGFMRLEHIWRLTYTDLPNVQKTGIKIMFDIGF